MTDETLSGRITVKLDDLLHERRMTLTELAERVGLTLANLSILKTGKAKPSVSARWKPSAANWNANREICWLTNESNQAFKFRGQMRGSSNAAGPLGWPVKLQQHQTPI